MLEAKQQHLVVKLTVVFLCDDSKESVRLKTNGKGCVTADLSSPQQDRAMYVAKNMRLQTDQQVKGHTEPGTAGQAAFQTCCHSLRRHVEAGVCLDEEPHGSTADTEE